MELKNVSQQDYLEFLQRILQNIKQRRFLLMQWHSCKLKEADRLATVFEKFITTILYDPIVFHLLADRFYLFFGTEYPILFEWISAEDQNLLIRMMKFRRVLFKQRKDFSNNQFDYSGFIYSENELVKQVWRQQIVRDFVWMVYHKNQAYMVTEMIVAVQSIQLLKKDPFLSDIHAGLQKRSVLEEVLCIK